MSTRKLDHLAAGLKVFLETQGLWTRPLGVAWSGGRDSTVLVLALRALYGPEGLPWKVLYFDHGIRGEAERAQEGTFVTEMALRLSLSLVRGQGDPSVGDQSRGPEDGARRQRFEFFQAQILEHNLEGLLLGHHLRDQEETRLMRLFQGNSFRGLAGMPRRRGLFLRPFLSVDPKILGEVLEEEGQPWWEDSTNSREVYLRNRVRRQLKPVLESLFPSWSRALEGLGSWVSEVGAWSEAQIQGFWKLEEERWTGPFEVFRNWPSFLRIQALQKAFGFWEPGTRWPRRFFETHSLSGEKGGLVLQSERLRAEIRGKSLLVRRRLAQRKEIRYVIPIGDFSQGDPKPISLNGRDLKFLFSQAEAPEAFQIPHGSQLYLMSVPQARFLGFSDWDRVRDQWRLRQVEKSKRESSLVLATSEQILGILGSPFGGDDFFFSLPVQENIRYFQVIIE